MPAEYLDSEEEEDLNYMDPESLAFYQKIVQKAYSIRGIRKLQYIFKQRRREAVQDMLNSSYSKKARGNELNEKYMAVCEEYQYKI